MLGFCHPEFGGSTTTPARVGDRKIHTQAQAAKIGDKKIHHRGDEQIHRKLHRPICASFGGDKKSTTKKHHKIHHQTQKTSPPQIRVADPAAALVTVARRMPCSGGGGVGRICHPIVGSDFGQRTSRPGERSLSAAFEVLAGGAWGRRARCRPKAHRPASTDWHRSGHFLADRQRFLLCTRPRLASPPIASEAGLGGPFSGLR